MINKNGMMEEWNNGIMCLTGGVPISFIIPSFHHSNIPGGFGLRS
jgi:hypothetical protein